MRLRPLAMKPTISAPISMPNTEPSPPSRLVPPRTTATTTSNSNPSPMLALPTPRREAVIEPAKAESAPTST